MSRACSGCGRVDAHTSLGGVILCNSCRMIVLDRIDAARSAGKTADAAKEARALFLAENSVGSYLLRDIPTVLWDQAKHAAVDRGVSLRDLILDALRAHIGKC